MYHDILQEYNRVFPGNSTYRHDFMYKVSDYDVFE